MQSSFMPDEPEIPRVAGKKKKRDRPISLWYRGNGRINFGFFRDWTRFGRYETEEIANMVREQQERKQDYFEFFVGERPPED